LQKEILHRAFKNPLNDLGDWAPLNDVGDWACVPEEDDGAFVEVNT